VENIRVCCKKRLQHESVAPKQWPTIRDPDWVAIRIGEDEQLQRLNVFFFYLLGKEIGDLEQRLSLRPNNPEPLLEDLLYPYLSASRYLKNLLDADLLGLQVARAPIQKLKSLIDAGSVEARKALEGVAEGEKAPPLGVSSWL
jgi:hypothetical protein